jgi:hypothetical protein
MAQPSIGCPGSIGCTAPAQDARLRSTAQASGHCCRSGIRQRLGLGRHELLQQLVGHVQDTRWALLGAAADRRSARIKTAALKHPVPVHRFAAPGIFHYNSKSLNNTYILNQFVANFTNASNFCNDNGGHLVSWNT